MVYAQLVSAWVMAGPCSITAGNVIIMEPLKMIEECRLKIVSFFFSFSRERNLFKSLIMIMTIIMIMVNSIVKVICSNETCGENVREYQVESREKFSF